MLPYDLDDRAKRDLAAARDWYDRQREGVGDQFLDAAFDAIRSARERPASFPEIHRGVRTLLCKRFKYRVYFRTTGDRITVLAVYHTSRDPAQWNDPDRE